MSYNRPPGAARPTSSSAVREHKTTDLDLSAFAVTRGVQIKRIEPPALGDGQPLAGVVFPRTPELVDAIAEWSSNSATMLNPRDFALNRRELFRRVRAVAQRSEGVR